LNKCFEIDWSRPWLAPLRKRGEPMAHLAQQGLLIQALNEQATLTPVQLAAGPLRFVPQDKAAAGGMVTEPAHRLGEAYESFIARTACVPTRNNLHDFFNALIWLTYPAWKKRLNELQAQHLAQSGVAATRGAVRDVLTVFDENAALLQAPQPLVQALWARDWHTLFVTQRALWAQAQLTLFGHALLEKLVQPRKPITAHVWVLAEPLGCSSQPASVLTPQALTTKPFAPLPVLGVPGWWPANEAAGFYADTNVFRVGNASKVVLIGEMSRAITARGVFAR
jgi:hypothetical protein